MNFRLKFILVIFVIIFGSGLNNSCLASAPENEDSFFAWYETMDLPTPEEKEKLEKFALSQGIDVNPVFQKMTNDRKAWEDVFRLSVKFRKFDRQAAVYGYQLYVAFVYYMEYSGEKELAGFLKNVPQDVKQSVRDFLYFQAYNADPLARKNNERVLLKYWKLIFPNDYSFANGNETFNLFIHKVESK